jgi:hypothetical protein
MKVNSYLFTLLACGALSTDAAMARHHGHHARSVPTASKSEAHSLANTPAVASKPQDSGSKPQASVAEHAIVGTESPKLVGPDKRIDDDLSAHTRKSSKTGISDNPDSNTDRSTVHGLHPTATRGSGPNGKESTADAPIDLRITVHQGRDIGRGAKERLFRKSKTTVAIGAGLNQQHFGDRQSARAIHRNAIGAIVDSEKTVKHDTAATRPAAAPVVATAAVPVANPTPQGTNAPVHDPNTGAVVSAAPTNSSSPAGAQNNNRAAGNAALVIVARNAPSISGTGLMRPGSGTGSIGGSPRIVAGVISGNSVHLKHP